MNKSDNNEADNNEADTSGNTINQNYYDYFSSDTPKTSKKKMSGGMIFLAICMYILFAILLPSCILFFITKWSAKSAIKSTVCSNPEILKKLFPTSQ
jgi:hypothetical protein